MLEHLVLRDLLPKGISAEKRQYPRAFVTIAVTCEVDDGIIRGAECRDISMGGMFVFASRPLPVGTRGVVTLTKKCDDERISFSAGFEVVRSRMRTTGVPGFGVKFISFTANDYEGLSRIVDFHLALMLKEKLHLREEHLEGIRFKIAETRDELEQAFGLLHDNYVRIGYMDPHPSGLRVTHFHALPQTVTFVGKQGEKVVMTTSLVPDSPLGLPLDVIYKDEIDEIREDDTYIAEIGSFAIHSDLSEGNSTIPLYFQKFILSYCKRYMELDSLVCTINPRHRLFYRHIILFEQISEQKTYRSVKNTPAIGLRFSMTDAEERYRKAYEGYPPERNLYEFFFKQDNPSVMELPDDEHFTTVWNRELLRYFFEERTDLFKTAEKKTVALIQSLYPK